ncbi:MAG: hypothetical protein CL942_04710 [Desulfovibrio sp.]|nr:hypothetical protein [Desulfovibrio sp.]|tara:strand:+ start:408 stop:731 length:324 start_codon:yes stop_codon:yes gene_type:complete
MERFIKSLMLGSAAGIIGGIPMAFQNLNWQTLIAAFLHWLVLGILVTHTKLPTYNWLSGAIIGGLTSLPLMVLVSVQAPSAWVYLLIISVVLGCLIGSIRNKIVFEK